MRSSLAVMLFGATLSATTLAAGPPPAAASLPGHTWASIAKLPDWSGVWELDWQRPGSGGLAAMRPIPLKLTPEYQARLDKFREGQKKGENEQSDTANCNPPGMPQIMTQPYPVEFLFTPGKVTVAIEAYSQMRRIFTDGRKHPEDPDPSYQGHSIGHWEGDTLVVDTVGFIANSSIAMGVGHSDQMRIVEHIRKVSPEIMEISTTITDPKVLTEPWTVTRNYRRHADWDMQEYVCAQNNRDSADAQGHAGMNLKR
jgi:hypothetical protein